MICHKITIFIDESGTLPDINDKVIVVAAVGTENPEIINHIFKIVKNKEKPRKQTGEIKFYTSGNKTKKIFFENMNKSDFKIFILEVEKSGSIIHDTPNHFALL